MNHEKIKDFLQNNGADYMLFKLIQEKSTSIKPHGWCMGMTNTFNENDLIFIDENSWSVIKW